MNTNMTHICVHFCLLLICFLLTPFCEERRNNTMKRFEHDEEIWILWRAFEHYEEFWMLRRGLNTAKRCEYYEEVWTLWRKLNTMKVTLLKKNQIFEHRAWPRQTKNQHFAWPRHKKNSDFRTQSLAKGNKNLDFRK